MDLAQLKTFCIIIEEKSFSRAAQRLFLTQPAISMQIKALENDIGQVLFDRSTKEIMCTEAGNLLYPCAQRVLQEIDNARNKIDEIKNLVRGQLTLGCSDTVSSYLLPSFLSQFLEKYPFLEVSVRNRPTQFIVRMVLEQEVDIGFVTMPVKNDTLQFCSFHSYHDVVLYSPQHPLSMKTCISLEDLTSYRLLLLEPQTMTRTLLEKAFMQAQCRPQSFMQFGSVEVQKAFARNNLGVAIVPDFAINKRTERCIARRIRDVPVRDIAVVKKKKRQLSPAANKFWELLLNPDYAIAHRQKR